MLKLKKSLNPSNILAFIFKEERRSSIILLIAAAVALLIANSAWSSAYFDFFSTKLGLGSVSLDIRHWINEGLMALFFLVVGLEIKRELVDGELNTWRKATFPLFAAVGGMLVPALIFSLINPYPPESNGWGIPMATDIALTVGVLTLLGNRVSKSLRVFLLSLAIVDDLGSILVISAFYNRPSNILALVVAIILTVGLLVVRRRKNWLISYLIIGLVIWYVLLVAGVSATLAGVVMALLMPIKKRRSNARNLQTTEVVEDMLFPLTSFVVVPLFVFANAGIDFSVLSLSSGSGQKVFLGVFLGLLLGKPLGITISSWLSHFMQITRKPTGVTWSQVTGIGFIAGIGFTIALLISGLAYEGHQELHNAAVIGIFSASIISAIIGLLILRVKVKK